MLTIISTLPHYAAAIPLIFAQNIDTVDQIGYIHVIFTSATLSVLYHAYEEKHKVITFLDYALALVWFIADVYMSIRYLDNYGASQILLLNGLTVGTNMLPSSRENYAIQHSVWHLASASKCIYVSYWIALN
jgi:hypothetical protein